MSDSLDDTNSPARPPATRRKPELLAPAGDANCYLAAVSAGADAVYLGLKHFSARMEAENFSLAEVGQLTALGHARGVKTYVAFNVMVKPDEPDKAARLIDRLARLPAECRPDALIVQDPGLPAIARQAGFTGELHLSTLANVSHAAGLEMARRVLDVSRVVVPRELSIDEIKILGAACPPGVGLEVFVHGALCYAVSGRCWWSSFLGGKSGLRGRCVQPCRRVYEHKGRRERWFSCQDLGLDVLVKTLAATENVAGLKIEGRKKGPHSVFYATRAYRLLLDEADGPAPAAAVRKEALAILEMSLGRPSTKYLFLPQRPRPGPDPAVPTGSGLLAGRTKRDPSGKSSWFAPRLPLIPGDLIRVGADDEAVSKIVKIKRGAPKGGRFDLGFSAPAGTAVTLIDRREPELTAILRGMNAELERHPRPAPMESYFQPKAPKASPVRKSRRPLVIEIGGRGERALPGAESGGWLDLNAPAPRKVRPEVWTALPPVLWPGQEEPARARLAELVGAGARRFLLGAPWQAGLFPAKRPDDLRLTAGPFCNLANPFAVEAMKRLGCHAAVVSPELPAEDMLALPGRSPLPLGAVVGGLWPLCVARTQAEGLDEAPVLTSPKGEACRIVRRGELLWVFPGWELDLTAETDKLARAGYQFLLVFKEPRLGLVGGRDRPSAFNWRLDLP